MGHYADLNVTSHQFYIFEKMKGPFTKTQNIKQQMHHVFAYDIAKIVEFFIVFPRNQRPSWRILNFWIFRKKQSALEHFYIIFENSQQGGWFQLSAESRYLQSEALNHRSQ